MKNILQLLLLAAAIGINAEAFQANAQVPSHLSLDSCLTMAKRNFPLIQQIGLIQQSKDYSIDNANKAYLPQVNISGSATYQSDVTKVPISIPSMSIPSLSKDQYKVYAELSQGLTDLLLVNDQHKLVEANSQVESQKIEVELYKLRERVSQLFFGSLLVDAQLEQTKLTATDIEHAIQQVESAVKNGTSTKSNLSKLQAELLKVDQRKTEQIALKKAYINMLSYFIGQKLTDDVKLTTPIVQSSSVEINRPELELFKLQENAIDVQNKLLYNKNLPRFSAFLQGGAGRPGLNMLNPDMQGYYMAGLRLNWNLSSFYTYKNDRKNIAVNKLLVEKQKETFLFNTNLTLLQQKEESNKFQKLIETDNQIVELRETVKKSMFAQLKNGIASTYDYMTALTEEDQARQNRVLHQIQLQLSQYNQNITLGN
ncbi:transporter [Sphingobacterium sp. DK4209]|uniref:Transporter n=1 Tax=Sphingobacterium zhuxiongii TaxID=2662364 RepID=A0A5Q0QFZ6_9SPHI|nr:MULTISPECIES: TolC family protein [unclassified Sphingobacterium]MVZ65203.1 transporter [Sphingobacterium sp. DK4209]QGA26150.1 transporter [Sphingobacterium sp. dk4302]